MCRFWLTACLTRLQLTAVFCSESLLSTFCSPMRLRCIDAEASRCKSLSSAPPCFDVDTRFLIFFNRLQNNRLIFYSCCDKMIAAVIRQVSSLCRLQPCGFGGYALGSPVFGFQSTLIFGFCVVGGFVAFR